MKEAFKMNPVWQNLIMNSELELLQKIVNELLSTNRQQERLIEEMLLSLHVLIGKNNIKESKK